MHFWYRCVLFGFYIFFFHFFLFSFLFTTSSISKSTQIYPSFVPLFFFSPKKKHARDTWTMLLNLLHRFFYTLIVRLRFTQRRRNRFRKVFFSRARLIASSSSRPSSVFSRVNARYNYRICFFLFFHRAFLNAESRVEGRKGPYVLN